jgi:hypothetical protein
MNLHTYAHTFTASMQAEVLSSVALQLNFDQMIQGAILLGYLHK